MTSPQSTIHLKFILFHVFLTDRRSLTPDLRSPILDPSFPVNLKVLLIKIVLFFPTTEVITCSKAINAFKQ